MNKTNRLVDATNSQVDFKKYNYDESEHEESDEDDLIKDVANDFRAAEKTGSPIGENLAKIMNKCNTLDLKI